MTYEVVSVSSNRITVSGITYRDTDSPRLVNPRNFRATFTYIELVTYQQMLDLNLKLDNAAALFEFWGLKNVKVSRAPQYLGLPAMQINWVGKISLQWRVEDPEIKDVSKWETYGAIVGSVKSLLDQIEEYKSRI